MTRYLTALVASMAYLLSGGCSKCEDMGFASLEKADRIVVKEMSKNTLGTITEHSRIVDIVRFTEAHENDWIAPVTGTRIGSITLEFYSGENFLGHLGIGKSFLEAQGCGYFFSHSLSKKDLQELVRLAGFSESLVE